MTQKERARFIEIIRAAMAAKNYIEPNVIENVTWERTNDIMALTDTELFSASAYVADYERCEPLRLNIGRMLSEIPLFILDCQTKGKYFKYALFKEFLKRNGIQNEYKGLIYSELLQVEKLVTPFYESAILSLSVSATQSLLKELSIPVISTPVKKKGNAKSNKGAAK